jgi:hypothetical protein
MASRTAPDHNQIVNDQQNNRATLGTMAAPRVADLIVERFVYCAAVAEASSSAGRRTSSQFSVRSVPK